MAGKNIIYVLNGPAKMREKVRDWGDRSFVINQRPTTDW